MGSDNRKGILYAVATASLWGFMAIVIKLVVGEVHPVTVVWFRFSMAFLILAVWSLIFRRDNFRIFFRPPLLIFLAAIFLGLNYTGFIVGVQYTSPSIAQVFIQIGPVSFALSGILIFREQVNWKHILGFLLVVSGIGLFYSEQIRELAAYQGNLTRGMLLVMGSGLSWAAFSTSQKALLRTHSTGELNLFIFGFCALILTPLARFGTMGGLGAVNWALLIYLGLNTVLAYGSLAMAIKFTEATRVSVVITLNPILTFVAMAILSRMEVSWIEPESFSILSVLGALTVLGGAIMVISAGWKKKNAG